MPTPAAPDNDALDPLQRSLDQRDTRIAGETATLEFKIATANLLPVGASEIG